MLSATWGNAAPLQDRGPTMRQPVRTGNGMAIAGFVCALVGIFVFQFILGPLGLIFGAIGWSGANRGAPHRGLAIASVIIGTIDIILFIFIALLAVGGSHGPSHEIHLHKLWDIPAPASRATLCDQQPQYLSAACLRGSSISVHRIRS